MSKERHKIPLLLKFKRIKNSEWINNLNDLLSPIKKRRKFKGIPDRILLLRNDRIGDAVVTMPVIESIKKNYPHIKIDILASSKNRFVFEKSSYINELITFDWNTGRINLLKHLLSPDFKDLLLRLKNNEYDAVIDLVGLKRNILLGKTLSKFTAGPRKLLAYLFYSYYGDSNWVTLNENDFMTVKIKDLIESSLGLRLNLVSHYYRGEVVNYKYDIIIHLGSTPLRKLTPSKEDELISSFYGRKVLVTDGEDTKNFRHLFEKYAETMEYDFRLFSSLDELAEECKTARVLICYDGGQAHYLSKYIRTVTIFGPGSVELWKPYEYSEYELLEKDGYGAKTMISKGNFGHIVIFFPVWCRPCFDVGCKSVLCLQMITPGFIHYIVEKYCFGKMEKNAE